MSPSPASKRRRLNAASSKLSQPFKSPFKTPLKPSSIDPATHSSSNHPPSPLNPTAPTATSNPVYPTTTTTTTTTVPPLSRSDHSVIARPTGTPRARGIIAPPSPQLARLQKRHTALLGALASARASLETHAQALKLETSSTDRELQELIAKWKGVSREAAEQVLTVVAARVEGMGGVKGWRQKEREKREGFWGGGGGWGWEEEGAGRNGEDEGGGDERDDREAEERERKRSIEEEENNEETFTMSMMLRSLNIDLQLIGYDPEAQKWID